MEKVFLSAPPLGMPDFNINYVLYIFLSGQELDADSFEKINELLPQKSNFGFWYRLLSSLKNPEQTDFKKWCAVCKKTLSSMVEVFDYPHKDIRTKEVLGAALALSSFCEPEKCLSEFSEEDIDGLLSLKPQEEEEIWAVYTIEMTILNSMTQTSDFNVHTFLKIMEHATSLRPRFMDIAPSFDYSNLKEGNVG